MKRTLKKKYNFCKDMTFLKVRDMSQEAKFPGVKSFIATIQPLTKISVERHGMQQGTDPPNKVEPFQC